MREQYPQSCLLGSIQNHASRQDKLNIQLLQPHTQTRSCPSNGWCGYGSNPKYKKAIATFASGAIAYPLNMEMYIMITQSELNQFSGTSQLYKHWLKQFTYTDGVQYLAQKADAYWLIDAIASHQPPLLRDEMLREFQIWKLIVNAEEKTAKLICERDTEDVAVTQDIPFTDFPLPEVKLFLVAKVLMLPSEY